MMMPFFFFLPSFPHIQGLFVCLNVFLFRRSNRRNTKPAQAMLMIQVMVSKVCIPVGVKV